MLHCVFLLITNNIVGNYFLYTIDYYVINGENYVFFLATTEIYFSEETLFSSFEF